METVVPTKGNLKTIKNSSNLAKIGLDLMNKKRSILVRELMLIIKHIKETYKEIQRAYTLAYKKLQLASVTFGTAKLKSLADTVPLDNTVKVSYRSIMGVEIPVVSFKNEKEKSLDYGFYNSNSIFDETFKKFTEVKALTAKLVELVVSVFRLANALEKIQKRANSLRNVVIPKFSNLSRYVEDSLEEKDREEFSRLKVVKKQKGKRQNTKYPQANL